MNIGLMDSGIGGITLLKEIIKIIPNYHYIYYGDSINNPYGEKDEEEIFRLSTKIVDFLIDKGCKIIVIACNTITTTCIDKLRKTYLEIIFIGTYPPIKVALDNNYKNILVMGTTNTLKSDKFLNIIRENNKNNNNVYLLPCPNLASMIEENSPLIDDYLFHNLDEFKEKNIDAIVLGCTHYPLIKNNIKKIFDVLFLDSSEGIIKQLLNTIKELNILSGDYELELYNSDINKINKCYDLLNEK